MKKLVVPLFLVLVSGGFSYADDVGRAGTVISQFGKRTSDDVSIKDNYRGNNLYVIQDAPEEKSPDIQVEEEAPEKTESKVGENNKKPAK